MPELQKKEMEQLLNTEEAGAVLRLSPRTLERFRVQGAGPRYYKIGRLVYYSVSTLEEWKAARLRASTSDQGAK
ncbi:MAG TPA: helix-turn-helix domain-containing protein [Syntrophobacteraceae bacterium]|nr:helix-turn-helix domain-containing protein [Syntrophobacteraceae bacterium]